MWKELVIYKNYYTTEVLLVYFKDIDALIKLMELLNIYAASTRKIEEPE